MVQIWGHRGCSEGGIYENTEAAFRHALTYGQGLECDIIRTNDGALYLAHDTNFQQEVIYELDRHLNAESVARMAGRRLDQVTKDLAETLKVRGDKDLPSLGELFHVFQSLKGEYLNLELKGCDTADLTVQAVEAVVSEGVLMLNQIIVSSFDHSQLSRVRKLNSDIKIGVLFEPSAAPAGHILYPWRPENKGCYIPFSSSAIYSDIIQEIQPDFWHLYIDDITEENINQCMNIMPQSAVNFWQSMKESVPRKNLALQQILGNASVMKHVHAIMTNFPRQMREFLS